MGKVRSFGFSLILVLFWLNVSGWGGTGHRMINGHAPASFPGGMSFLKSSWTPILVDNATAADDRKATDPDEAARHYLDIDNYSMFLDSGKIPMSFDSVKNLYGISFVLENGILPWATITAFDSVKACFQRKDFNKAALFAADLGHYIGDGHMPLHITRNYNGQYTSQNGIHGRYETRMIDDFSSGILYSDDPAYYITDVSGYIFTYLYANYRYTDSVLLADNYAVSIAGNDTSGLYYQELWNRTGRFTTALFKHASASLASLIYTAWVEAGSPNGVPLLEDPGVSLGQNVPNPFSDLTEIRYSVISGNVPVELKVYNCDGIQVAGLVNGIRNPGSHEITWNARNLPAGVYYYVLQTGNSRIARKAVIFK